MQIPVAEKDVHKTAFVIGNGCYDFLGMPFGKKNTVVTLVCQIWKLFQSLDHVESYIDDVIVYTKDWDTHLQVLDELLHLFQQAHLAVRPTKCLFGSKSVGFLGRLVGGDCITINEENLEKIR